MKYFSLIICIVCLFNCKNEKKQTTKTINETVKAQDSLIYPGEKHFKSIRQVTFGGDNAEAYWSFDDKQIVFQSNNKKWNVSCDQMF